MPRSTSNPVGRLRKQVLEAVVLLSSDLDDDAVVRQLIEDGPSHREPANSRIKDADGVETVSRRHAAHATQTGAGELYETDLAETSRPRLSG